MTVDFLLQSHLQNYPLMREQDLLKLLYQRNFGCGHLVSDENAVYRYMKEEWEETVLSSTSMDFEPLGNDFVRFSLAGAKKRGIRAEALSRLFYMSAGLPLTPLAQHRFLSECSSLEHLCKTQQFQHSTSVVSALVNACKQDNFHPFRHSKEYRDAYQPHYRVVCESLLPLLPILELPELLTSATPSLKDCYLIAIDGRCASGKTTLADLLSHVLKAPVIHMDDFFLPPELRTEERLAEPGGNIHYERFQQQVVPNLKSTNGFTYQRYDCHTGTFTTVTIPDSTIRIIEGAYCFRPEWQHLYDTAIFSTISPEEQKERILQRDGEIQQQRFMNHWIPLEEHYLSVISDFLTSCIRYCKE